MLVKFCGATSTAEVRHTATAGADLVGLWYRVPGGPAELSCEQLTALATTAHAHGVAPVLVTFGTDPAVLLEAVRTARIPWVQLHGFQSPGVVRALRRGGPPGLKIAKVLHLKDGACVEDGLTGAYERAGADCFLYDAVGADGRLGSTARTLADGAVTALADRTGLPFLLAGGLRADNRDAFAAARAHPRFLGIDVDSAARDARGLLDAQRATAVTRAWRTR
ncbi:N-(5'-phosphoribosyl)anthranilate isomerase [Streptomyces sp. NPDC006430]|uniref:phosphoribosylanthranilate isomerase n=1 Tax=Streptomyces sp. NPDC006430 TaxID=3154299 RepID=UPI0033B4ABB3